MWKNTIDRYGSISIAMHWLMLVLVAVVYACIETRSSRLPEPSLTTSIMSGRLLFYPGDRMLHWLPLRGRLLHQNYL